MSNSLSRSRTRPPGVFVTKITLRVPGSNATFSIGVFSPFESRVKTNRRPGWMTNTNTNVLGNRDVYHLKMDTDVWDLPATAEQILPSLSLPKYVLTTSTGESVSVNFLVKPNLTGARVILPEFTTPSGQNISNCVITFRLSHITMGPAETNRALGSIVVVEGDCMQHWSTGAIPLYLTFSRTTGLWTNDYLGAPVPLRAYKLGDFEVLPDPYYKKGVRNFCGRTILIKMTTDWTDIQSKLQSTKSRRAVGFLWFESDSLVIPSTAQSPLETYCFLTDSVPKTLQFVEKDLLWERSFPSVPRHHAMHSALADAVDGMQVIQFNGLMFLRENIELAKFVFTFGKSLGSKAGRSTLLKKMKTNRLKPSEVKSANAFLLWHYGIRLSYRDWKDFLTHFKSAFNDPSRQKVMRSRGRNKDINAVVYFQYEPDKGTMQTINRMLYNYDLEATLSNLWDAIPYSFVVDWFTGVTEKLEDRERASRLGVTSENGVTTFSELGLKIRSVMLSSKTTSSTDLSTLIPDAPPVPVVITRYVRWVLPELPFIPVTFEPQFNMRASFSHIPESLSLLIQKFGERKR